MRSVFVLTQKPSRMQSTPDEYAVEHAYPIISGFAISMSQPRQSVINLSAQPPGSGFAFNQPKKGALLFCCLLDARGYLARATWHSTAYPEAGNWQEIASRSKMLPVHYKRPFIPSTNRFEGYLSYPMFHAPVDLSSGVTSGCVRCEYGSSLILQLLSDR